MSETLIITPEQSIMSAMTLGAFPNKLDNLYKYKQFTLKVVCNSTNNDIYSLNFLNAHNQNYI